MKIQKVAFLLVLTVVTFYSCETPDDILSSEEIAAQLEGQWIVNEQSSDFKKTQDFYYVQIYPNSSDSTQVFIENFYDLGSSVIAIAQIIDTKISLPNQTLSDGTIIYGSGTISSDYSQIDWLYYADIGTGVVNEIDAVYKFQY